MQLALARSSASKQGKCDLPSGVGVLFVQLRPTLLAVVLVWTLAFLYDADTATVLPDTATVTLYEQSACVLVLRVNAAEGLAHWRARVVLVAADASRDVLLVTDSVIRVIVRLRDAVLLRRLSALTATWRLTDVFAGQRVRCCGLVYGSSAVRVAVLPPRRE